MPKLSHKTLIAISGSLWLAIGFYLLPLGLKLFTNTLESDNITHPYPLLSVLEGNMGGRAQTVAILVAISLFIGFMKGRYVLKKSVKRTVNRIRSFPDPTSLGNIFAPSYYILIAVMMMLGMGIRFFGAPDDIRGLVDVAIGAALIDGGVSYFREAFEEPAEAPATEKSGQ